MALPQRLPGLKSSAHPATGISIQNLTDALGDHPGPRGSGSPVVVRSVRIVAVGAAGVVGGAGECRAEAFEVRRARPRLQTPRRHLYLSKLTVVPTQGSRFQGNTPGQMRRSGWFERRLLLALVLFSFVPSLLLVGVGTILLRDAAYLQSTPAVWENLAESGRRLLELSEASGDTALVQAAAQHREELTVSVQQAQRWAYLNRRAP